MSKSTDRSKFTVPYNPAYQFKQTMTKNNHKGGGRGGGGGGRRRRKNSKDISDDEEEDIENADNNDSSIASCSPTDTKGMSFADRREFQRKAAADKRRQKMKCHLCGKEGHTRKQCPGIEDGGRGSSKYTKSNGDAGATILKNKGRKKNHERGQKQRSKSEDNTGGCTYEDLALLLPSGFDRKEVGDNDTTPLSSPLLPPFKYFDAGFDEGTQVLEYLRFGRGVKVKHSRKEAIEEYDNTMKHVYQKTNFGGCITRCYLPSKHNTQKTIENAFPFNVSVDGSSSSVVYFVVGLGHDFVFDIIGNIKNEEDNNDKCSFDDSSSDVEEDNGDAIEYLVSTVKEENNNNNKIVGVFADLDYTYMTTSSKNKNKNKNKNNKVHNHDRDIQLRKLRCTVKAAIEIGCAIQIRILPSCSSSSSSASSSSSSSNNGNDDDGGDDGEHDEDIKDPYLLAIQDLAALLATLLAETTTTTTTTTEINNIDGEDENGNNNKLLKLKIHLSCWNGKSEHMMVLLKAFPNNLYIGFDSTITFQKATHIHECAFDVPLNKLVLETGSPSIIPSCIANSIDTRYAFCHSGYIPIIANEIAKYSSKNINNLNINNLKENVCATTDTVDDEDDTTTTTAKEIEVETGEAGGISTTTTTTTTLTLTAEMVARIASTNTMSLYGIS